MVIQCAYTFIGSSTATKCCFVQKYDTPHVIMNFISLKCKVIANTSNQAAVYKARSQGLHSLHKFKIVSSMNNGKATRQSERFSRKRSSFGYQLPLVFQTVSSCIAANLSMRKSWIAQIRDEPFTSCGFCLQS